MIAKARRPYVLTKTAEMDFIQARNWSRKRWGNEATKSYFEDIEQTAIKISENNLSLPNSSGYTQTGDLKVWPVREHYLVYLPVRKGFIVIVSLIRQDRDVPGILASSLFIIMRELKKIDLSKLQ